MSRNVKILLAVIGGVCLVCVIACAVGALLMGTLGRSIGGQLLVTDPTAIAAQASQMVDYTLPEGYHEMSYINMVVVKMLMIGPIQGGSTPAGGMVILFAQLPANSSYLSRGQIQQQMQQQLNSRSYQVKLVGQQKTTVRGQDVTLYTYEGTDQQGKNVRELVSDPFNGKSGSLFLMVVGPVESWNQMQVNWFIGSIR